MTDELYVSNENLVITKVNITYATTTTQIWNHDSNLHLVITEMNIT